MQFPAPITDLQALARNRVRAARAPALFLLDAWADELQERLNEVNRTFTAPAVVSPFAEFWRARLPSAHVVHDTEVLALQAGGHDLVIHALCLHWANDPVGQLVQCRRALRPDGMFIGGMFGGRTLSELRAALAEAEVAVTGGLSPRVLPMGEIRDLGALLQRAGFALPVADSALTVVQHADAFRLMADLRAMGEGNALAARLRRPTRRAVLVQAAARHAAAWPAPDCGIRSSFEVITLTGWAPHERQQKPLRPGSAIRLLADALKTPATPETPRAGPGS